jgi:AbrB family looped-hinge helix DNA binding protein
MGIAQSKVTAQGQVSIPARVRQKLGIGPGSVLEWSEKGEDIVIRRIGQHTSEDVHRAVFRRSTPPTKRLDELKEGIRSHMKKRYARH